MRLTEVQKRMLSELRHMRVPPEAAILSTRRLAQLLGGQGARRDLLKLEKRGLVERLPREGPDQRWRLTEAGREEAV